MKPLVSIITPAYNAEEWVAESIQSAVAQTWPHKEIIVVNDGSTDRTGEVAQRFAAGNVKVLSTENRGMSAAINTAYGLCQGDYIQELDADDLLAPDKIEKQLAALRETDGPRTLLSGPRGYFRYSTERAWFPRTCLWQDLTPVEWLLRSMGQNLPMQNSTWLVSRELAEAAGPWDEQLQYDQDGEYYCRVLLTSVGTRFVPEARMFHRLTGVRRVSYVGNSDKKKDSLFRSMKLHTQYLRSLEESERVRKACLAYLQTWYECFYPERPDLVAELQALAAQLQGRLEPPRLRWKYAWMKPVFGEKVAKWAQTKLPEIKSSLFRGWDRAIYRLEARKAAATLGPTRWAPVERISRADSTPRHQDTNGKIRPQG
jgi:glycosyltransferase involved in cell wall biosynthesis